MTQTWMEYASKPEGTKNLWLDVRFNKEGKFLPESGNTVVAQVIPGSSTEHALIWLRHALQALPFGHQFAFTEVASYHMTLFEGVIDSNRQVGFWPASLPLDTHIDVMTSKMAAMLDGFMAPPAFFVKPVEVRPFGLGLAGASAADETNLRAWRDALSKAFGFRTAKHDEYQFHTTLAYIHSWLPETALPNYQAAMAELTAEFISRVPIMELAPAAFCRFADMNAFPPVRQL